MNKLFELIDKFLAAPDENKLPKLLVIVGPTSSGKTVLSLELAEKYFGEIVSADSRQIYLGMDIGTDKVAAEIRQKIPHHLIDIASPNEVITLFEFKAKAEYEINLIHCRNRLPILVGGTGLYTAAITENYQIPQTKTDFALRYQLQAELEKHGADYMYQKLQSLDPTAAKRIDRRNHRYLLRALEINLLTARNKVDQKGQPRYHALKIGIDWPREILYHKVNDRVDFQISRGLIEETRQLLEKHPENLPSMSALGYPQIIKYLKGELSLEAAIELLKKDTRSYARRQLIWLRRDREIHWLAGAELF